MKLMQPQVSDISVIVVASLMPELDIVALLALDVDDFRSPNAMVL
jgi:hypothetical protein